MRGDSRLRQLQKGAGSLLGIADEAGSRQQRQRTPCAGPCLRSPPRAPPRAAARRALMRSYRVLGFLQLSTNKTDVLALSASQK